MPVAAIGASAGGVSALQTFFEALPTEVGAAFVVIVHLDPEHQSELPRIIAARTRMPVVEVDGERPIEADKVYVIPPNRQLLVSADRAWEVIEAEHGKRIRLVWTEHGGPAVRRPTKSGFGSVLIDHGLPDAQVKRDFRREGLVCTIELRLRDNDGGEVPPA